MSCPLTTLLRIIKVPVTASLIAFASIGYCDEPTDIQARNEELSLELFEKDVRPTLLQHCVRCHGPKKQQAGLRLDSRTWVEKGGESGAAVTPGNLNASLLIEAIRYDTGLEMPPKGKLPEATIEAFERWVTLGAVDPRIDPNSDEPTDKPPTVEEGRSFWSFQKVTRPAPPVVQQTTWPQTTIDHFILAKLESKKLSPAPRADRRTLIRRVYYDLIGLPPTPEQIVAFVNNPDPNAYAELIDRLLDSPQFGERWGRHWLDVVRFAESSGGGRTLLFPNAWRYRDYVINAFNDDMPFKQFITEQIAGDLIASDPSSNRNWQAQQRQMIATAFLLLGPTNYELQDKDILEMDVVDEQIDTIGKSMLGMTIGCARCHDHKFDPIPTKDYYAMAGILKSTKAIIHSNVSTWNRVKLPVSPREQQRIQDHEASLNTSRELIADLRQKLKELGGGTKRKSKLKPGGTPNISSTSLPGIVIDDVNAELIGKWTPSTSAPRYVDQKYIHDGTSGKGEKHAIYRPQIPRIAQYEIRVGYSPSSNRSQRVPVHIHHSRGKTVVRINQQQTPEIDDAFTSVGVFQLDPGKDPRIVISNEDTDDGVVIADAVVLIESKIPALPAPDEVDIATNIAHIVQNAKTLPGVVVDDVDAKLIGEWKHSVHTPPFVGASYIHDLKEGKGEKSATFTPNLPHDGTYEVRVSHNTNIRRADNVPITIRHANGSSTVRINQSEEAPFNKLFRSLGQYDFTAGTNGTVTFSTKDTSGKYVIVDAVQFIPIGGDATAKKRQREALTARIRALESQLRKDEKNGPQHPLAMVTADDSDAGDIPLAIRGVVHNKGPIVPRGVMQVAADVPRPKIAAGESGRRELARWIANTDNPLTARVIANRVWYWLTGRGIVPSVDNFGSMGDPPTHPELLDHLASSFVQNGWSIKQLIRDITTSRFYQGQVAHDPNNAVVDPDNFLLWRMNRKRLRAEDIRDTLLFVGGTLDRTLGGSNIKAGTNSEYGYVFTSSRRSVYLPVFRNTLPEIFEVFDFADPNIQRGNRTSSTIASQALLLMNHPFVVKQCELAAERLLETEPVSTSIGIEQAYLLVVGRPPTPQEAKIAAEFIETSVFNDDDRLTRWSLLFQTLFQCVDFRYLN